MKSDPCEEQRKVKHLSLSGRGLWMSLRCALWQAPTRGARTLTFEQWLRELSCTAEEFRHGLQELEDHPEGADWRIERPEMAKDQKNDESKTNIRICSMSILAYEYDRLKNTQYQSKHYYKGQNKDSKSEFQDGLFVETPSLPLASPSYSPPNHSSSSPNLSSSSPERARRMPIPLPDGFVLTDEHRAYAHRCAVSDPEFEFEKFCDRNRSTGTKYLDWDAALRNWFRNARNFNRRGAGGGGVVGVVL